MESMYAGGTDFVLLLDDEGLVLRAGCVLDESVMRSVIIYLEDWLVHYHKKTERTTHALQKRLPFSYKHSISLHEIRI